MWYLLTGGPWEREMFPVRVVRAPGAQNESHVGTCVPYMWVILCLVGYKLVGERLAAFARARKRSDVTRGHMWARKCAIKTLFDIILKLWLEYKCLWSFSTDRSADDSVRLQLFSAPTFVVAIYTATDYLKKLGCIALREQFFTTETF